jgi:hypothetical protein
MSKFRALLGGLAAIGMLAAIAAGGLVSASGTTAGRGVQNESVAVVYACLACVGSSSND